MLAYRRSKEKRKSCSLDPLRLSFTDFVIYSVGVFDDLVRISCGVEDAADLVKDVLQATERAAAESAKTANGTNGTNGTNGI